MTKHQYGNGMIFRFPFFPSFQNLLRFLKHHVHHLHHCLFELNFGNTSICTSWILIYQSKRYHTCVSTSQLVWFWVSVTHSIWRYIRTGSWHLCMLTNPSNDAQLIVILEWPDVRLQRRAVFSGTLQSAQRKNLPVPFRIRKENTLMKYFCCSVWFGGLFFRFTRPLVEYSHYAIMNQ